MPTSGGVGRRPGCAGPATAICGRLVAADHRGELAGRRRSATVLIAREPVPGSARPAQAGLMCGRGSAGRASPCQGEGRGFESRRPLGGAGRRLDMLQHCQTSPRGSAGTLAVSSRRAAGGGMAEWLRQGPAKPCTRVRFPLPPRGRLAQRESASLTRKRSLVQSQYRPPGHCKYPNTLSSPKHPEGRLRGRLTRSGPLAAGGPGLARS
jgi:hypothetical protein